MPRPLILGEAPSKSGDRFFDFPLSGAIGKRLCEFAGLVPEETKPTYGDFYWLLREDFDCINTIERYKDAEPWNTAFAKQRWLEIREEFVPEEVVCLGIQAAAAVGVPSTSPWGAWYTIDDITVVKIPHPSGRNLLYNDPTMRALAGRVLRGARCRRV